MKPDNFYRCHFKVYIKITGTGHVLGFQRVT